MLWESIMKEPLVSTLICTYNAENTIHWALQSVMDQTYENQEILILDNNSKDKTLDILKDYQKKDKRIKIFSLWKNLWAYWWLNFLLDKSKWKYIAIQDHDDVRHPNKLEKQVDFLEKNKKYIWDWTWYLEYYCKSKVWFLCDTKEKSDSRVNHTSLVFRNCNKRYNTENDYLSDILFMKKILCEDIKKLYILPWILTLHYCKETWENYSSQRFKINRKNTKRHFYVHWFDFYHLCLYFYVCICSIIPRKLKRKLDYILVNKIKWGKKIEELWTDKDIEKMLEYLEK